MPIARRWSKSLLTDESIEEARRQRAVLDLNERIFALCCRGPLFLAVLQRHGIDPFEAVLADPLLPEGFLSKRYPQMRARLADIRR